MNDLSGEHKLYTTKSDYRLHIAIDKHYQGSVNCYSNFITKSISKLFLLSIDIAIDGKKICVNKKSYTNFLKSVGNGQLVSKNLKDFQLLTADVITPVNDRGLMHDHISAFKSQKLARVLIKAMVENDIDLVRDALGKGADVNQSFWIKKDEDNQNSIIGNSKVLRDLLRYGQYQRDLPLDFSPIEIIKYTPFLYAMNNNNPDLADLLIDYEADVKLNGEKFLFHRKNIRKYHSSTDVKCEDTYSNRMALVFDDTKNQVIEVPFKYQEFVHIWSNSDSVKDGERTNNDYYLFQKKAKILDLTILSEL